MEEHFHYGGRGGRRGMPMDAVVLAVLCVRCVLCGPVPVLGAGARLVCRHPALIRSSVLIRTPNVGGASPSGFSDNVGGACPSGGAAERRGARAASRPLARIS